jgi:hypothetical protein
MTVRTMAGLCPELDCTRGNGRSEKRQMNRLLEAESGEGLMIERILSRDEAESEKR